MNEKTKKVIPGRHPFNFPNKKPPTVVPFPPLSGRRRRRGRHFFLFPVDGDCEGDGRQYAQSHSALRSFLLTSFPCASPGTAAAAAAPNAIATLLLSSSSSLLPLTVCFSPQRASSDAVFPGFGFSVFFFFAFFMWCVFPLFAIRVKQRGTWSSRRLLWFLQVFLMCINLFLRVCHMRSVFTDSCSRSWLLFFTSAFMICRLLYNNW